MLLLHALNMLYKDYFWGLLICLSLKLHAI